MEQDQIKSRRVRVTSVDGSVSELDVQELVIDLGNGEVLTVNLQGTQDGTVCAYAGGFPRPEDEERVPYFLLRPGACNVVTIEVKSTKMRRCTPETCDKE